MKKLELHNKMLLFSVVLGAVCWLSQGLIHLPNLAGALGVSTANANLVVNLISAYSTITTVISIIGAITGVGAIGSSIAASLLYIMKQKGKAKAALW